MADGPFDMSQRVTRLDQHEGFSQLAPTTSGATRPQPSKCSCELRALKSEPERTANQCQNSQDREDGLSHHLILSRMLPASTPDGRTMRPPAGAYGEPRMGIRPWDLSRTVGSESVAPKRSGLVSSGCNCRITSQ